MEPKKGKKTLKDLTDEVFTLTHIVKNLKKEIDQLKKVMDKKEDTDPSLKNKIKCHKCNKVFVNKQLLRTHNKTVHPQNFDCSNCDFKAKTISDIDNHILKKHSGQNNFGCDKCDKTFTSEIRQAMHKRQHKSAKLKKSL